MKGITARRRMLEHVSVLWRLATKLVAACESRTKTKDGPFLQDWQYSAFDLHSCLILLRIGRKMANS